MQKVINKIRARFLILKDNDGFTLIELLIVVAIIAIMGAVAVRLYTGVLSSTNVTAAKTDLNTFSQQLEIYYLQNNSYPSTEEGLQKLIDAGLLENKKSTLLDPWNNPYQYRYPGEFTDKPEIWSLGADGVDGGEGSNADIISWE